MKKEYLESDTEGLSPEDADKIIEELQESWRETSKAMNRAIVLYLITAALFELLIGSKEDLRFSLAGLQFSNSTTLQRSLPAIAGYLYYDSVVQACRWIDCQDAFDHLWEKFRPSLGNIAVLMKPSSGVLSIGQRHLGESEKLGEAAQVVMAITFAIILPIAFCAQSSYLLIDKYGWLDPLSLASIILSIVFVLFGMLFGYVARRNE
ncbi:hypothetical protein [Streptomyces sp. GESEQ-35]|uniref:hypothetical protein n=1 Tax=Streptomyces sp. GESEQ-35 TaxID=2812657 RepID=UPI001B33C3B2|nr:hypothetical protein [Streptomyces sp. GESEQ-35]